jgi:tetrahydromethanopterin S-methyltransferase subunit B
MTTEFELRDRIRTVLMNSLNQHHYSKMEDELAAVIKEIVAESVVPLQKRINALESLVDELEEDLEAAEDRYRSIT